MSEKRPPGRPPAEIDWKEVDEYLEAGCTGTQIAGKLGIAADTLYNKCEQEHKVCFSAYCQEKRASGEALLHKHQFDLALGKTKEGDRHLLIWLGKTRLGQKESVDVHIDQERLENFDKTMNSIADLQLLRQNASSEKKEQETSIDEEQ